MWYKITAYTSATAITIGRAWTKATLDTAQIGYNISTTNTNAADISTVWMSVDSTPASPPSGALYYKTLLGVGTL